MGSRKDADKREEIHIFTHLREPREVCEDADDLLPAATRIQAQQDNGTEEPVVQVQTTPKDYMAVIEEHALEARKLVIVLLYLILPFFWLCLVYRRRLADNHSTPASLYTSVTCTCADNTRRSVGLQLWGLCVGAHNLCPGQRCAF